MRPKLVWRLGFPALAVLVVHVSVNLMSADGETPGILNLLLFAMMVLSSVEAWRHRVVIDGPVIYQRGLTRWKPPLDVRTVDWVDLRWEFDRLGGYRLLQLGDAAAGWRRSYQLRWWGAWREIIRGLVRHRANADALGDPVWNVEMPAKARPRLDRYARKFLSRPR